MSEDRTPYGDESQKWEQDAREMRDLIEKAGLNQVSAAAVLGFTDRAMRGYVSGREPVPRTVLLSMRWIAEHQPNLERYLQVHWKAAGVTVTRGDKFKPPYEKDGELLFEVNGKVAIRGTLTDLLQRGVVSIHTTFTADRFRLELPGPADSVPRTTLWLCVPNGKALSDYVIASEDRETAEAMMKMRSGLQLWSATREA